MTGWQELAEWDWVLIGEGTLLHAVAEADWEKLDREWGGKAVMACGRRAKWAHIPGWFTRQSAQRCGKCCDAFGYPRGEGSPKNDLSCRPLVEQRLAVLA